MPTVSTPAPWQRSQRPPATLSEKCPLPQPRSRAAAVSANRVRMGSKTLV